jgi:methionine-rich copper-binding protein CopC
VIGVLSGVALGVVGTRASGHAVAVGTSLQQKPIRAGVAGRVTLKFNSAIELGLSRVFLVSKGDKFRPLEIVAGGARGELIVEIPALDTGDYALKYRVFAADGHLTEDVIRFRVEP